MIVQEAMTKDVVTINSTASISGTATLMGEKRIGGVVVVEDGKPVGILTERDILTKVVGVAKDAAKMQVKDVMSFPLKTIDPKERLERATQAMTDAKIRRLAVIEDQRLVGIVTAADIVRVYLDADRVIWDLAMKNLVEVKSRMPRKLV
ncbi:MAG: CBS domain-containing protein [Candidatus Hydrothermarchaeales archaeon]